MTPRKTPFFAKLILTLSLAWPIQGLTAETPAEVYGNSLVLWQSSDKSGTTGALVETDELAICKIEKSSTIALMSTQFFSSKNEKSHYEKVRSTPTFKKNNRNMQSRISNGSLVMRLRGGNSSYNRIQVASIASSPEEVNDSSKVREVGFIYSKSLQAISDKTIVLRNNKAIESVKDAADLKNMKLKISKDANKKYSAVRCCPKGQCSTYYIFDILDAGDSEVKYLALRPTERGIFSDAEIYTGQVEVPETEESKTIDDEPIKENLSIPQKRPKSENASDAPKVDDQSSDQSKNTSADPKDKQHKPNTSKEKKPILTGVFNGIDISKIPVPTTRPKYVPVVTSGLNYVTCLNRGSVRIHQILPKSGIDSKPFSVGDDITLKTFPGSYNGEIRGKSYDMYKVQVSSSKKTGYIAKSFVTPKGKCNKKYSNSSGGSSSVGGSGDVFPLFHSPYGSYRVAPRCYGCRRSKGRRAHAATDLYSSVGKIIRSVRNGRLIRGPYYFYSGTYAYEARNDNGRVIRYGETLAGRVGGGNKLSRGEKFAKVGRLKCCKPMLHFEVYSGKKKGSLTTKRGGKRINGRPSYRREDLLNPTNYVDQLIRNTF